MKNLIWTLPMLGALVLSGAAYADHDKDCKNIHGRVTVVSDDSIAVNDKSYKVGSNTRLTKGEKPVILSSIKVGDVVCLDPRGQHDLAPGTPGEIAAVTVLSVSDTPRERQFVREKETIKETVHDKNCKHLHGKVSRVTSHTFTVDGKVVEYAETTRITKNGQPMTLKDLKSDDFVCVDLAREADSARAATTVVILTPSDAEAFGDKTFVREKEKIREEIREEK